jgi:hypothetical protein
VKPLLRNAYADGRSIRSAFFAGGAAFALLLPCLAAAQLPDWAPKPPPRVSEDTLRAEVLVFGADFDTTLRVDESLTELGTEVSAEDDLGLDDTKVLAQGELTLLPGDHHLVRLSGIAIRRSAQKILDIDVAFDDETYFIGERVDSELNLTMFGLTYGYRFLVRDRGELTGTFGIQIAEVEANAVVRSRVIRDAESGVAPIPFAGLEGRFDFSSRWSAEGRVQYLTADIDEVDGSILDARFALTWRKNPHLVFGLGYRTFEVEIDSRNESTPGFIDMSINGPLLFMRASL